MLVIPFYLVLDNTYPQAISYLIPHQPGNKPGERPGRREQGGNEYPHSRLSKWTKCCITERAKGGERTLSAFFERVAPFGVAFMALFGRADLPHRATLSRFLASVDRPCLEAFRQLFEHSSFAEGWTPETIGGIWDRQGRRYLIFDVDATRQAARQRALPCDPTLPSPRRRLDAVCAPGYTHGLRNEMTASRR
jgi:hypothetical protein